jgi:Ca2+-binding RTX toxin-like protein
LSKHGDNGNNSINGSNHDDVIDGRGGNDTLFGGGGDDVLYGGDGNDVLAGGTGSDTLHGGAGNDTLVAFSGKEVIDGGSGNDLLDAYWATQGVTIDLGSGAVNFRVQGGVSRNTFVHVEGFYGSHMADTVTGDKGDNYLFTREGNDVVHAGAGNDVINGYKGRDMLYGEAGDDIFVMAPGHDTIDGGDGIDTLDFYWAVGRVTASLADGKVAFVQAAGNGSATFTGVEAIYGSNQRDTLTGDAADNLLDGRDGNDSLRGLDGRDFLIGLKGNDRLYGGAGRDFFLFDSASGDKSDVDTIEDFADGEDRLAFNRSTFDVASNGPSGLFDMIHYHGTVNGVFQSAEGHVAARADIRILYDESNGRLYYDANGSHDGGLKLIADIGKGHHITAADIDVFWV